MKSDKKELALRFYIDHCNACNGSGKRQNSDVKHYEVIDCYKCAWAREALL